ncbi:MAG: hypothetical protein PUC44_06615 [Eubacteriales bacterium]|nr:hypothetical protein [Eubacteriales bacterium]
MKYVIQDITEADFGCEERPEKAPLLCCLVLKEMGAPKLFDASEMESMKEMNGAGREGRIVRKEIPDRLADELYLTPGQVITGSELSSLQNGEKPEGWDDLSHRSYYQTDIGMVCMSAAEYRDYQEQKEILEMEKRK